jgi:hypothetical protein
MNLQPTLLKSFKNRIKITLKKQIVERCKAIYRRLLFAAKMAFFGKKNLSGETNARNEASRTDRLNGRVCDFFSF